MAAGRVPRWMTPKGGVWRTVRLVSLISTDKHCSWTRGELSSLLLLISYTNCVDGGLQAWFERLRKVEGFLQSCFGE